MIGIQFVSIYTKRIFFSNIRKKTVRLKIFRDSAVNDEIFSPPNVSTHSIKLILLVFALFFFHPPWLSSPRVFYFFFILFSYVGFKREILKIFPHGEIWYCIHNGNIFYSTIASVEIAIFFVRWRGSPSNFWFFCVIGDNPSLFWFMRRRKN